LQRLAKYLLSEKISVETWGDKEIAVIKSKGCVLGWVSSVKGDSARYDRQHLHITFKNMPWQSGDMRERSTHWTLKVSAKPIRDGDIICLLQGASKPTIIRLCEDHFVIIMVGATPLEDIQTGSGYIQWPKLSQFIQSFTRDFILVWNWESSSDKLQDLGKYETSIRASSWVLEHPKTKLGSHLDKATRTWNVALILGDLEEYEEAEERLREAVEAYEMAFGEKDSDTLRSQYGQTPLLWAAGNGYDAVVDLLLANDGIDPDLKDGQYGQTPLSWAAQEGHKAVVKQLLETGKVDVDSKDSQYGQTPLLRAAQGGHEEVVKLLLDTGKANVDLKDSSHSTGETPLTWAALLGHEAVVKVLVKTGKVDVDLKDSQYGRTPLAWVALRGHEAVAKLLLKTGKVDVESKDSQYERTPLSWAAEGGHEAVFKMLLETGKVNVNSNGKYGRTPLSFAAIGGHDAVIKLLQSHPNIS
jgi:ankyrin repeat protein